MLNKIRDSKVQKKIAKDLTVTSLIHCPSPYKWESELPSLQQTPYGMHSKH